MILSALVISLTCFSVVRKGRGSDDQQQTHVSVFIYPLNGRTGVTDFLTVLFSLSCLLHMNFKLILSELLILRIQNGICPHPTIDTAVTEWRFTYYPHLLNKLQNNITSKINSTNLHKISRYYITYHVTNSSCRL